MKKQLCIRQFAILSIILFFCSWSFSQRNSYIHFDRPIYLSGEDVLFSLYSGAFEKFADAYILLQIQRARTGHDIYESYLKMHFGETSGSFPLPIDTQTGGLVARILFFDGTMFQVILEANIEVINPADTLDYYQPAIFPVPLKESVNLHIEKSSGPYLPGSDLELMITSLSPTNKPLEGIASVAITHQPYALKSVDLGGLQYYPCDSVTNRPKRLTWQRQLVYEDSKQPVINTNIAVFIQDEGKVVMRQTDDKGMFKWQLAPFYGANHVQYFCPFSDSVQILSVPEAHFQRPVMLSDSIELEVASYLNLAIRRNRINYLLGNDVPKSKNESIWDNWSYSPDYSLVLENYERVESLEELSKLLLTPLRMTRSKNKVKPKMINPIDKPFFKEAPLFIIDRIIQRGYQSALSLQMQHAVKIDFYNTPKTLRHFGSLGRNGVISITTKFPQLYQSNNTETLMGLQIDNEVLTDRSMEDTAMSSLRSVVYWNPSLEFDKAGEARINFQQTDDLGTFNIEVFFHTFDGALGHVMEQYEVIAPSAGN